MSLAVENQGNVEQSSRDESQGLLNTAQSYFQESVAPVASEIDENPEALKAALQGMSSRSLLGLQVPQAWGGAGVSELTLRQFQQLVPRYSGALAFLQTQHQSAGRFLANTDNEWLKRQYLPYMSQGEVLIGIGFSHIRRQGKPMVKAMPVEGGYEIDGTVPWITGCGFFQDFILGAMLPDGQAVYGMLPLKETVQQTGGTIALSKPMKLGAMSSTNTVTAELSHWFLPQELVLFTKPAGAIHENDQKNVLHHGFHCLGNTRAGLDLIEAVYQTKQLPFIKQAFDAFNEELQRCQSAMIAALAPDSQTWQERLQLRAWAINLSQRCATAAVTVSSGAANYRYHAAQRVYREALVFTVSGQTTAVMEATLAQLIG